MLTIKMGRAALGVVAGTLFGVVGPADETEFAARLNEARHAVLSGAGKEFYDGVLSAALDAQLDTRLKQLKACWGQGVHGTGFGMLLELAADGRVEAAMAWPESKIATCYLKQAKKDVFPRPPSAGFWVAVSLRFGKQEAIEVPVPAPARPVHLLIASLSSEDPGVRSAAAWELAGATELQSEARAALEPLRTDADRGVRYAVVWALGHLRSVSEIATATDETPPKPVKILRPDYPKAPFDVKIEGTVVVDLLIGEQGEVAHLEIRKSVPELDGAAMACVRQWAFEPGRVGGVPRATIAHAPVSFRIY
jgi:TonB family protein